MPIEITLQTIIIFVAFIATIFIFYKMFKLILRGSLVIFASFVFPWVAQYLGLPIAATIQTGIDFAILGFVLFFTYEFFHFIVQFFRILMWPFKRKK